MVAGSAGFATWASNPALDARARSSGCAYPLTATSRIRESAASRADRPRDLVPVHAGEADVAEHHVGRILPRTRERRRAVVDRLDRVAEEGDDVAERLGRVHVVVHDEHPPSPPGRPPSPARAPAPRRRARSRAAGAPRSRRPRRRRRSAPPPSRRAAPRAPSRAGARARARRESARACAPPARTARRRGRGGPASIPTPVSRTRSAARPSSIESASVTAPAARGELARSSGGGSRAAA